ncbi:MAG: hypothetical protein SFV15_22360 [Polyangiaceae bacterium]|nr:hypothetical protein [Polyangiaceae bacterium]
MAVIAKGAFWVAVAVAVVAPGGVLLLPFLLMKRKKAVASRSGITTRQS